MMEQLVLDIHLDAPPDFGNFVAGENGALIEALALAVRGEGPLYLWGDAASGRSHLLRASVALSQTAGRPACYLAAETIGATLPDTPGLLIALDDVDRLRPDAQIALFNTFNRARRLNQTLLLAGPCAPRDLGVREDTRTRIGQGLIFELRPLDDRSRTAILAMLAERRGLRLGDEVIAFILRHGRRDLPSLVGLIDALDRASLEHKRPITLPLLRTLMQTGGLSL